jgi:hypothetical protein
MKSVISLLNFIIYLFFNWLINFSVGLCEVGLCWFFTFFKYYPCIYSYTYVFILLTYLFYICMHILNIYYNMATSYNILSNIWFTYYIIIWWHVIYLQISKKHLNKSRVSHYRLTIFLQTPVSKILHIPLPR